MATLMVKRRIIIPGFLSILLLGNVGCGGNGMEAEVEGTVTWQNEPLRGVRVTFIPEGSDSESPAYASGITDATGHYVLLGAGGNAGTVAGSYRVVIIDPVLDPGREMKGRRTTAPLDAKGRGPRQNPYFSTIYSEIQTTPLRQVVAAGKQVVDFHLP